MSAGGPIVTLDHVSLEYRLHTQRANSLRDWMVARLQRRPYRSYRSLWALKDVVVECRGGDRVGVLGSNGAGKTTLLRVIAGIYPPTRGTVHARGRVVPLLELGLGFNPEMTGAENIMLASVLLGRTRREARGYSGEVLEFAGVAEFADVPVKYYSSGMAARLAFAIAMQTDPDVLLLDEVFAVGDTHWVQRAEQRMRTLLDKAKVVVAVSHNAELLKQFCNRGLYLDRGQVRVDGTIDEAAEAYVEQAAASRTEIVDNRGHSTVRLRADMEGPRLRVTAEAVPLFGECWVGLFEPGNDRDGYLAYRRVTLDAPAATFAVPDGSCYEARLYRWTPAGETLEASAQVRAHGAAAPVHERSGAA